MRNITLSADPILIDRARETSRREGMSLNDRFRLWLEDYTRPPAKLSDFQALINDMEGKYDSGGRRFSRDEINARR